MRLAPDHPLVQLALGQYYYEALLDYESALTHFDRARQAAPSDSEVIMYIAFVLRRQGKWKQSVEENQLAMDLDPRNVEVAFNLGTTYWLMREYDKADEWHARAAALGPGRTKIQAIMATQALFGEGDRAKARSILDAAANVVGESRGPVFALISIQVAIWMGQHERALREIEALDGDEIELNRHFVPKALLRAQVTGQKADFEAARKVATRFLDEGRGDATLHSALGIALAGLGRKDEAVRAGKRGVDLLPMEKDSWAGSIRATDLAHIYAMVGEHEAAIDLLEILLANPGEIGRASLAIDPRWTSLREHPRFKALAR